MNRFNFNDPTKSGSAGLRIAGRRIPLGVCYGKDSRGYWVCYNKSYLVTRDADYPIMTLHRWDDQETGWYISRNESSETTDYIRRCVDKFKLRNISKTIPEKSSARIAKDAREKDKRERQTIRKIALDYEMRETQHGTTTYINREIRPTKTEFKEKQKKILLSEIRHVSGIKDPGYWGDIDPKYINKKENTDNNHRKWNYDYLENAKNE